MWDTYRDLANIYFPNCMVAVDSFHVIRHLNDAMDSKLRGIMSDFQFEFGALDTDLSDENYEK